MRRVLLWLVAAPLMACMLNAGLAASVMKAATSNPTPTFMVVMMAEEGEIKREDGKFTLSLKKADTRHILTFGDRPLRVTEYISKKELKEMWVSSVEEGGEGFAHSPPNAVVVIGDQMQAVQLVAISYKEDHIVFILETLDEPIRAMKGQDAAVFIDGIEMVKLPATPNAW